ncbi:hypothetical protein [Bosea sp. ANAM02]|uniref:hypothetical protein n=1 Tax=Bosea sp. ANAM02 TaxID=2020412 RepID=UPI00140E9DEF|nr:hypothetical protein [Bosea sp. ANAM02]BCB17333.1 hypothetical protein OCUBac02_02270 [Bosea sp. ANAM02]
MTVTVAHDILASATPAPTSNLAAAQAIMTSNPDAELIALTVEFEALELGFEQIYEAMAEAEEAHPGPEAPEAMFVRPQDPRSLPSCRRHDGLMWYRGAIDQFRSNPMVRRARTDDGETVMVPDPAAQKRADEIVAAFDHWQAACERDKVATGRAEIEARHSRAVARFHELMDILAGSKPATIAGAQAKARAILTRKQLILDGEEIDNDRKMIVSIAEDLVRLA